MFKSNKLKAMLFLLIAAILCFSACGNDQPSWSSEDIVEETIIIEPGLNAADDNQEGPITNSPAPAPATDDAQPNPANPTPNIAEQNDNSPADSNTDAASSADNAPFNDLGEQATIEDIMANKALVNSCYFRHNINETLQVQTIYKDAKVQITTQFGQSQPTIDFYDWDAFVRITYSPGSTTGLMSKFDSASVEIPRNFLLTDYHQYTLIGTEIINNQTCLIIENETDKLWISTLHGLPLQAEVFDYLSNETYLVQYLDLTVNNITDQQIALPEELSVYDVGTTIN